MCASSLGHSVPIVNGEAQKAGKKYAGSVIAADADHFAAQIGGAYGDVQLTRTFTLLDRGIRIRDEAAQGTRFAERFVTEIPPQMQPDGSVRIGEYTLRCTAGAPEISTFSYLSRFAEFDENERDPHTVYMITYPETEGAEVTAIKE